MKLKEERPLYQLAEVAEILRSENGCAWDKKQTWDSLKTCLIEETYEVYEAIENNDPTHLREELGDYLYQAFAHAQIAREADLFTIDDVAADIVEKLIRRHPHVFGNESIDNPEAVIDRWEEIKKDEKSHRESALDGIPSHLPALQKAWKIQKKASKKGFDWTDKSGPIDKLDEEIAELKKAVETNNRENIEEEAGDILFSIVNLMRFIDVNPEEALRKTIDKFSKRFRYIEKAAENKGMELSDMSLEDMDSLWDEAKTKA